MGERAKMEIGLVGRPRPETIFTPPSAADWHTWQRKLQTFGDPVFASGEACTRMNDKRIPEFAIVGHPNEGKSSVVSTLAEDDSVRVTPTPRRDDRMPDLSRDHRRQRVDPVHRYARISESQGYFTVDAGVYRPGRDDCPGVSGRTPGKIRIFVMTANCSNRSPKARALSTWWTVRVPCARWIVRKWKFCA